MRQQAPGTSTADNVEDGVKDLTQGVLPGPSGGLWGRQVRLYARPLGVGKIGWVRPSHTC
jgi:hypothetical protein